MGLIQQALIAFFLIFWHFKDSNHKAYFEKQPRTAGCTSALMEKKLTLPLTPCSSGFLLSPLVLHQCNHHYIPNCCFLKKKLCTQKERERAHRWKVNLLVDHSAASARWPFYARGLSQISEHQTPQNITYFPTLLLFCSAMEHTFDSATYGIHSPLMLLYTELCPQEFVWSYLSLQILAQKPQFLWNLPVQRF